MSVQMLAQVGPQAAPVDYLDKPHQPRGALYNVARGSRLGVA